MYRRIASFLALLLVIAIDCNARVSTSQMTGAGKNVSRAKDVNVRQRKRDVNPATKPFGNESRVNLTKIKVVERYENDTTLEDAKLNRRPQRVVPPSSLKVNITNRLAAHRYDKKFNLTKRDVHLLFNENNISETGKGVVSAGNVSVAPRNRTNTLGKPSKTKPGEKAVAEKPTRISSYNNSNVNNTSVVKKKKPLPKSAPMKPQPNSFTNISATGDGGTGGPKNIDKGKPIPDTDDNVFNIEYPIPDSLLKLENESVIEFTRVDEWIRKDITNNDTILIAIYFILPLMALYGIYCTIKSCFALSYCFKGEKERKQPYLPLATIDDDELMVDGDIDANFEDFMRNGEDVGRQLEMGSMNSRYDRRHRFSSRPSASSSRDSCVNDDNVLGRDEDTASF